MSFLHLIDSKIHCFKIIAIISILLFSLTMVQFTAHFSSVADKGDVLIGIVPNEGGPLVDSNPSMATRFNIDDVRLTLTSTDHTIDPGDVLAISFNIRNNGSGIYEDSFSITMMSLPAGWTVESYSPSDAEVDLFPGEEYTGAGVTISTVALEQTGTYNCIINVTCTTATNPVNASEILVVPVSINEHRSVLVEGHLAPATTMDADSDYEFVFNVSNGGNIESVFSLSAQVTPNSWGYDLSDLSVSLNRFGSDLVTVTVSVPHDVMGRTDVFARLTATHNTDSGVSAYDSLSGMVTSIESFSLSTTQDAVRIVPGGTAQFGLSFLNTGNIFSSNFSLKIDNEPAEFNLSWDFGSKPQDGVAPGYLWATQLSVQAENNLPPDNISLTLEAYDEMGTELYNSLVVYVEILPVYGVEFKVLNNPYRGSPSQAVSTLVNIENTGTVGDTYSLVCTSYPLAWLVDIELPSILIEAGSQDDILVQIIVPHNAYADADGTTAILDAYSIRLELTSVNNASITPYTVVYVYVEPVPDVVGEVYPPSHEVTTIRDAITVSSVITVTNVGNLPDTYTVSVDSQNSTLPDAFDHVSIQTRSLLLAPNETKVIGLDIYIPDQTDIGLYLVSLKISSKNTLTVVRYISCDIRVVEYDLALESVLVNGLDVDELYLTVDDPVQVIFQVRNNGSNDLTTDGSDGIVVAIKIDGSDQHTFQLNDMSQSEHLEFIWNFTPLAEGIYIITISVDDERTFLETNENNNFLTLKIRVFDQIPIDTDGDNIPDEYDLDADGDGMNDDISYPDPFGNGSSDNHTTSTSTPGMTFALVAGSVLIIMALMVVVRKRKEIY